jgi:D-alanyl-D-alanine carboxypeptidase
LPANGPFAIQIGAYSSESEAQRQLQAAKNRAGALLADRVPAAFPVDHSGRKLYRARFAGFDAQGAAAACAQLHRLRVDCVVAKPD